MQPLTWELALLPPPSPAPGGQTDSGAGEGTGVCVGGPARPR